MSNTLFDEAIYLISKNQRMGQAVWKISSSMLPDLLRAKSPSGEYLVSCQDGQYHLMGFLVEVDDTFDKLTLLEWGTFEKVGPSEHK